MKIKRKKINNLSNGYNYLKKKLTKKIQKDNVYHSLLSIKSLFEENDKLLVEVVIFDDTLYDMLDGGKNIHKRFILDIID